MPFPKNPDGFSPEPLGLLDVCMTKLWLQQVDPSVTRGLLSASSSFERNQREAVKQAKFE